jgi:hypothetical protein
MMPARAPTGVKYAPIFVPIIAEYTPNILTSDAEDITELNKTLAGILLMILFFEHLIFSC